MKAKLSLKPPDDQKMQQFAQFRPGRIAKKLHPGYTTDDLYKRRRQDNHAA